MIGRLPELHRPLDLARGMREHVPETLVRCKVLSRKVRRELLTIEDVRTHMAETEDDFEPWFDADDALSVVAACDMPGLPHARDWGDGAVWNVVPPLENFDGHTWSTQPGRPVPVTPERGRAVGVVSAGLTRSTGPRPLRIAEVCHLHMDSGADAFSVGSFLLREMREEQQRRMIDILRMKIHATEDDWRIMLLQLGFISRPFRERGGYVQYELHEEFPRTSR